MGSEHQLNPILVFFLNDFFVGSSTFQKNLQRLDQPTLVFFCIFEKKYNDWIESFSKSKWTGLKDSVPPVVDRPHPLTTPLTVPPTSLGSKEASGRQIAFTLSSKTNGESNFRIARSESNALSTL